MNPVHYHGIFPPDAIKWEELIVLIGEAREYIARYDNMLEVIGDPQTFLTPLTTQEAVLSSRIEGTQATITEVLQLEAQEDTKTLSETKRQDIYEIINYRRALVGAIADMQTLPMCNRMILKAHTTLMSGVRGQYKKPGEYRTENNWIGPVGSTIEQAYYIPPPAMEVVQLMNRWEHYINSTEKDLLVQLALLHVEFEAIHPFLDGNGRLGRMLIPLFMFHKKLIREPVFYISGYFEAHRDQYYEKLRAVSRDGKWLDWCIFFLQAVIAQAKENLDKAKKIFELYNKLKEEIPRLTRSQFAMPILDAIFNQPIFQLSMLVQRVDIPNDSARRLIHILLQHGIVIQHEPPKGRRSAMMVLPQLLNIAEGREIF